MQCPMATTASLLAPSAVWKVFSTGSGGKERFTFVSTNFKEKRSFHKNIRTVVYAGEPNKSFQPKLKEKKKSKVDDQPDVVTAETEEALGEHEAPEGEVTEARLAEEVKPVVKQLYKKREVDYKLAKQKIESEVKKIHGSVKESDKEIKKVTDETGDEEIKAKATDETAGASVEAAVKALKNKEEALRLQEALAAKKWAEAQEAERKRSEQEALVARKLAEAKEAEKKRYEARKREIELALARERERAAKEQARKREIIKLADASTASLNKMFYYPPKVEAGAKVEIYLNRSITTLADENNLQIMGAFNGWRWQSFTSKLERSDLPGDWWSCTIEVPKEAYKIDIIFFNGENVYENNNANDFFILVEGGMNEPEFEKFLIVEKRKEAERLASEQAERERAAEEARKLAEEKAEEEADRAESVRVVAEQRERAREVLQKAVSSVPGLWNIEPAAFKGGQTVKLFYNRSSRPLAQSGEVWIHGGYNNWKEAVSIVTKLSPTEASPTAGRVGDWWSAEVVVPKTAFMLNWVLADGPPEKAVVYDNNDYQDFHTPVPEPILEDLYWADVQEKVFADLREERRKLAEAARKKVEDKARMKEEMKRKTKQAFLQSQSYVYYTDPVEVQAGKPVAVLYNPSNTVLNGKAEVWLRHSFNRWTHPLSPFPPVRMLQTPNSSHLKASVEVPEDAYIMDFVFSESGRDDGGTYDNRGGFDYHVPVVGSFAKEPPMSIVHISLEMAPIAKVGGLGDVVTSLSRAVQELGHNVEVIVPKYDCLKYNHVQELQEKETFDWGGSGIRVWNGKVEGLNVHFIEPENGFFWVGCIYGRRDDGNRFAFFCGAALEFLLRSGKHPDIIHCHDWSSAPVAWLFQESYKHYGLSNAKIVFTIHNLEFGISQIGKAMANADMATTVSYSYAQEVSGNSAIAPHRHKFHGIRNGIDLDIWDPFDDPYIPMSYTAEQVVAGKAAAKSELQHRLGLERVDKPLVGIITRLTAQKGIHLIKHAIWRTLERGGQVVLLGSAPDPRVQNDFVTLSNQLRSTHNEMARLCLTYDEPLSHLIYAGADFILVPSIFEPCGLTQLIAMRYGAIPVVRKTGGLNDTVFDVDHDKERAESEGLECNGFSFEGTDAGGVDYALNRAISAWYEARQWFNSLSQRVMEQDWSWNRPAFDYVELYHVVRK